MRNILFRRREKKRLNAKIQALNLKLKRARKLQALVRKRRAKAHRTRRGRIVYKLTAKGWMEWRRFLKNL